MSDELQRIDRVAPLPERPADGHKGLFGRILILGGSDGMIGAPAFAGAAALRMGAGLVQLAVPRSILAAALAITPECTGIGLGKASAKDDLLKAAEAADAIVIGPGLGRTPEAEARLVRLVRLAKPMVIDADGLNILAAMKKWPAFFKATAVLTPHPGEMKRLVSLIGRGGVPSDDDGRIAIAAELSRAVRQIVVLKGHRTVVTDGRRFYLNDTGDSTLSKAGAGDVLSGILGTLLAQRIEPFAAACLGVHLHGRAGELAGSRFGRRSALAREVIDCIGEAAGEIERAAR